MGVRKGPERLVRRKTTSGEAWEWCFLGNARGGGTGVAMGVQDARIQDKG